MLRDHPRTALEELSDTIWTGVGEDWNRVFPEGAACWWRLQLVVPHSFEWRALLGKRVRDWCRLQTRAVTDVAGGQEAVEDCGCVSVLGAIMSAVDVAAGGWLSHADEHAHDIHAVGASRVCEFTGFAAAAQ